MKKVVCLILILSLCAVFCGCGILDMPGLVGSSPAENLQTAVPQAQSAEPSSDSCSIQTEPLHSQWYVPGVSQDQMLEYFCEVALDMEYTTGPGDPTRIQKWTEPIACCLFGEPTEEDVAVLEALFAQLNDIEGFPGICLVPENKFYNLSIYFLAPTEFDEMFTDVLHGEVADGASQYWYYDSDNTIQSARVGYRTDIGQELRSSVLLEEIVNAMGLNDTLLRPDSILYQYGSDAVALSDVDWVILRMLYTPAIKCGMDADDCREILRERYY